MDGFNPACVCCGEGGWEVDDDGACAMKQFLVVASDDFRDNLRIQQEVGSCLRNMISLSEPVQLESPNGHVYPVEPKGELGDIVFRSGWKEFVCANHIEENDSILFVFRGNSRFKLHIFDSSGLEKSSCSQPSSGAFGAVPSCCQIVDPPPPQIIDLTTSDDDEIMREGTRESWRPEMHVTRSCAEAQKMASTSSPSTKSGYKAHKPHDRVSVKLGVGSKPQSNNLGGLFQHSYILPLDATLPRQVENKVKQKVRAIRSEFPIFVKVLSFSSVDYVGSSSCSLTFCMKYASACLPRTRRTVFLQLKGTTKLWQTRLDVLDNKQRLIYKGWKEFARQNGLEVGDICLFQLTEKKAASLRMTVHLIRKSEIEP